MVFAIVGAPLRTLSLGSEELEVKTYILTIIAAATFAVGAVHAQPTMTKPPALESAPTLPAACHQTATVSTASNYTQPLQPSLSGPNCNVCHEHRATNTIAMLSTNATR
jgi:hypothetical protein